MAGDQVVPEYYDDVILPSILYLPKINEKELNLELLEDIITLSPSLGGDLEKKADESPNEDLPLEEDVEKVNCTMCDYKGTTVKGLQLHMKHKHRTKRRYQCTFCSCQPFRRAQELTRHVRLRHSKEKKFICPHCDYGAPLQIYLKRHIVEVHQRVHKYQCGTCNFGTDTLERLERHSLTHSNEAKAPARQCMYCSFGTETMRQLKHHIRVTHENKKEFSCHFCTFKTVHSVSLKTHLSAKHRVVDFYDRPYCQYSATREENFKQHLIKKHNTSSVLPLKYAGASNTNISTPLTPKQEPETESKFILPNDNEPIASQSDNDILSPKPKKKHTKTKQTKENDLEHSLQRDITKTKSVGVKIAKCKKRGRLRAVPFLGSYNEETDQGSLNSSWESIPEAILKSNSGSQSQGITPIKNKVKLMKESSADVKTCPHCPYICIDQRSIVQHIKVAHEQQKLYNCPFCQFRTLYSNNLTLHIAGQHTKEGIHHCPLCSYTTVRINHMKAHVEAHLRKQDTKKLRGKHKENMHSQEGFTDIKSNVQTESVCEAIQTEPVCKVSEQKKEVLHCQQCTYSTRVHSKLERHVQSHEPATSQKTNWAVIIKSKKPRRKVPIKCPKCNFIGEGRRNLNVHIKTIHEDRPQYSCPMCEFRTIHPTSLNLHIMSQHIEERSYLCNSCSYTTSNISRLKKHILTHHESKQNHT